MAYGRALTPAEAKSGKYKKNEVIRVGSGLYFRDAKKFPVINTPPPVVTPVVPPVVPVTPTTTETTPPAAPKPMTYDEWRAQSSYSDAANNAVIGNYDPYFNQQLGAEDYSKQLAQEVLGRNINQTTENTGMNFNDRGLYGSGVYQSALTKSLDNLNRGFNEQYGTGQYTPFSLRKAQIEENRRIAKEQGLNNLNTEAWNVFNQQYLPSVTAGA